MSGTARERPEDVIARLIVKGGLSAEDVIAWLKAKGHNDEEIVEHFERHPGAVALDEHGRLRWDLGEFKGLHQHRLLRERLAAIALEVKLAGSDEDSRAAIIRLHRQGLGEKAIAKELRWSEATIYRIRKRLGLIPWPKD
jgi:hypothetical protein